MSKHRAAEPAPPPPPAAPAPAASVGGWRLRVIVFVSGAVLMGLEMAGSRVLATHFGSSIYVWGSIIGIFLAALSVGYFAGGRLADARPSFFVLNAVVFGAGAWMLLIPFFANPLCRSLVQSDVGDRMGPLLATTLIFAGPSILMGVVSPFAIRLAAGAVEKIGGVSGNLYALSTVGSIAGTMITAFWLIPSFGVRAVIVSLGATLTIAPFLVLPRSRGLFALALPAAVVGPAALFLDPAPVTQLRPGLSILYEKDSAYHYVLVLDDHRLDARWLQFNNYIESGIARTPPYDTRATYTDSFHLARVFRQEPKRILIVGGGGGVGARKFVKDLPGCEVDLIEIDPVVADVCTKFFHVEEGPRLRLHVEDGRRFVRRAAPGYDLVVLDAYTIGGQVPFHLTTQEFMREIRSILAPGGVLLANINSAMEGRKSLVLRSEAKTIRSVFGAVYAFPRPHEDEREAGVPLAGTASRNVMLVAVNGPDEWTRERVDLAAADLARRGLSPTETFLDDSRRFLKDAFREDDVPLLTDDYAPVDTMAF
jgi:spermidine synthase